MGELGGITEIGRGQVTPAGGSAKQPVGDQQQIVKCVRIIARGDSAEITAEGRHRAVRLSTKQAGIELHSGNILRHIIDRMGEDLGGQWSEQIVISNNHQPRGVHHFKSPQEVHPGRKVGDVAAIAEGEITRGEVITEFRVRIIVRNDHIGDRYQACRLQ